MLEPNYTRIVSTVRKRLGLMQSIVEVNLPIGEHGVKEVYSIGAQSTVIKSDVSGNNISFVGLVDFQAIIGGENSNLSAVDYSAEFKDNFVADKEIRGEVVFNTNVIDVVSQVIVSGVKVTAIVETQIDLIESNDVSVLVSTGGDVECTTRELSYMTYVGKATEKFDVTDEINISGADKVYMATPSVCLLNIMPKSNYLIVSGVLNLDICYGNGDDISSICMHNQAVDFSWEVALDEIKEDSYIQSSLSILFNEIKLATVVEDGGVVVNVVVPINYTGYVFKNNTINVIDDLYSKGNFISITSEEIKSIKNKQSLKFNDNISGVASVGDNAPFIDDVLGVTTSNIIVANSFIRDNELVVEGIVTSNVLYYTKDTLSITAVKVEMPFIVEKKTDGGACDIVTINLCDVSVKSRRGKEIEVSAEMSVFVDVYCVNESCVISEVQLGGERPKDDCSLYVYIVKQNQTLWDIAKEMCVSESDILDQNPNMQLPLVAGEKIVIYNPKIMVF